MVLMTIERIAKFLEEILYLRIEKWRQYYEFQNRSRQLL